MASRLDKSRREIAACMMEVWEWLDDEIDQKNVTENGTGVLLLGPSPAAHLDDIAGYAGFADALALAGWVVIRSDRLEFPNFNRHNGASAKTRAVDAKRKRESRKCPEENRQEPPPSSLLSSESGSVPRETSLLIWNQYSALYLAYPRARRGSKGDFGRFLLPAWNAVAARGDPEPCPHLLPIVTAYAGSWLVKSNSGVVGPERFFDHDGVWTQDPKDWEAPDVSISGKLGGSISRGDSGEARATKRDREYPEEIVIPITRVGGHRAGGDAAQAP